LTYLSEWAVAFALTELVEVPIVVGMARTAPLATRVAAAFFATLATHPIVWFVLPELGLGEYARLFGSEAWAIGGECVFYRFFLPPCTWPVAARVAVVANVASFALGLLYYRLFH
jgi:hypothetical protein